MTAKYHQTKSSLSISALILILWATATGRASERFRKQTAERETESVGLCSSRNTILVKYRLQIGNDNFQVSYHSVAISRETMDTFLLKGFLYVQEHGHNRKRLRRKNVIAELLLIISAIQS